MKRNYIPFVTGMVTMLLLVGVVGASLAKEDTQTAAVTQSGTLNGQVAYGKTGVALFGKEQVAAGATRTTEKGAVVPTVLTYTDEKGETHYFINAETTAEVLDVAYGVVYRPDLNCVDFGTTEPVDEQGNPVLDEDGKPLMDKDGNPVYWSAAPFFSMRKLKNADGTEQIIATGSQKAEVQMGNGITITASGGSAATSGGDSEAAKQLAQERLERRMQITTTPEYGVSHGVFTEVDPAEMDKATYLGRLVDSACFQAEEVEHTFGFIPELKYGAIVIENQGKEDILADVLRPYTVGDKEGCFTQVRIPAGKALTRAFEIENGQSADLQNKLAVKIISVNGGEAQVRLSSEQYSGSVKK